jgi:hypothetical protein
MYLFVIVLCLFTLPFRAFTKALYKSVVAYSQYRFIPEAQLSVLAYTTSSGATGSCISFGFYAWFHSKRLKRQEL